MIKVTELTKNYGGLSAVQNLSFSLHPGEITVFLGLNGAGKTSTLKMIVGLLSPSSGSVRIGELILDSEPEKTRAVLGFVPDRPLLYDKLTCTEFLTFLGRLYRIEKKLLAQRIDELLCAQRLADRRNSLVEELSQGMKQRVSFCAAFLHNPKALLFDEPFMALDPQGMEILKKELRSLASSGKTILLSTHNLSLAQELAHRILIIHHGKLLFDGANNCAENSRSLHDVFLSLTASGEQCSIL